MVSELARVGIGLKVASEVVGVVAAKVLLFDLVNVGQVVGAGDINLALVNNVDCSKDSTRP